MKRWLLCTLILVGTLFILLLVGNMQTSMAAPPQLTETQTATPPTFRTETLDIEFGSSTPTFADFDNDGDFDVIFSSSEQVDSGWLGTVAIYENDNLQFILQQSLIFTDSIFSQIGRDALSLTDFDQNGYVDVLIADQLDSGSYLALYMNHNGVLDIEPMWTETITDSIYSVAWGDIDRDGDDDLTFSTRSTRLITQSRIILLENTEGTLSEMDRIEFNELPFSDRWIHIQWADINQDGWLDLLTKPAAIFLNQDGTLDKQPAWQPTDDVDGGEWHNFVVADDFNQDGFLDVFVDKAVSPLRFYNNVGGLPETTASISEFDTYHKPFVGDIDGDGDFDLITYEYHEEGEEVSIIYFANEDGVITTTNTLVQVVGQNMIPRQLLDIDGNGSLDIVASSSDGQIILLNMDASLRASEPFDIGLHSCEIALGDMDGDTDLDIVFSSLDVPLSVSRYGEAGYELDWQPSDAGSDLMIDMRWVDIDGDEDLDLAANNQYEIRIYQNHDGTLEQSASQLLAIESSNNMKWGDINGDQLPDLLVDSSVETEEFEFFHNLFLNEGGLIATEPTWSVPLASWLFPSPAELVDYDSDGDLDVSVSGRGLHLFENINGVLTDQPITINDDLETYVHAWGDVDLDGDSDLISTKVGIGFLGSPLFYDIPAVRLNTNKYIEMTNWWEAEINTEASKFRWYDVDSDGDSDLIEHYHRSYTFHTWGNLGIFANERASLASHPLREDLGIGVGGSDFGDVDLDGIPDIISSRGCGITNTDRIQTSARTTLPGTDGTAGIRIAMPNAAGYHSSGTIHTGTIPVTYTLHHPAGQPFRQVNAFYSLSGGGKWFPAAATSDTITQNLTISSTQATYVFNWDVNGSGFFGQSDNVMFRIEALPSFNSSPRLGGVNTPLAKVGANSHLLRVRGTQAQVTQDGEGMPEAVVLRLVKDEAKAQPIVDTANVPRTTNLEGFLQGYGTLEAGDQLFAMLPITATGSYSLYHTSGAPTPTGVEMHTVSKQGVQQLAVSAENPLMLLNLDISLEWDARNNPDYLTQLQSDIQRTSDILYDLTNGQAALGDVTIYQDREQWLEADIVIKADNTHRPNANLGGMVDAPLNDELRSGEVITNAVLPGQIRMGAIWNRYGEPTGTIGEDWPRVLAHEIGHYAFFQIDNYLGFDPESGLLTAADCQGSAMTDAYRQDYAEFLSRSVNGDGYSWDETCANTLAEQTTGRSDWETIRRFYPFLNENVAQTASGPSSLPLAVTQINVIEPSGTQPVDDEFFYLTDVAGGALSLPDARAYRLVANDPENPLDDELIALGQPIGQLVQARGAKIGDRICAYDKAERLGCVTVSAEDRRLPLQPISDWNPQIDVIPATSTTLAITVTQPTTTPLYVQFYPQSHPTRTLEAPIIALTPIGNDVYTGTLQFPITIFSGDLRLWENVPSGRERISNFAYVPGWSGSSEFGWGGLSEFGWGGLSEFGWGGLSEFGWGANVGSVWFAPVASAEGQVTLLNVDNIFGSLPGTILQRLNGVETPTWLTPVGDAYRYITDREVEDEIAIQFRYLERNLPVVPESQLRVYYRPLDGSEWQRLETILDETLNLATVPAQGDGDYAVMATIELPPFTEGWNSFGYPIIQNRPISTALASIQGKYTSVYHGDGSEWLLYDTTVPPEFAPHVNTLHTLDFAKTYWVYATETVTGFLGIATNRSNTQLPATYYGWLDEVAVAGDTVTLSAGEQTCATATVITVAERPAYVMQANTVCSGSTMRMAVNGKTVAFTIAWDNQQAQFDKHNHPRLYIPVVQR